MNEWYSAPLADRHELGEFDCSEESLNQWLSNEARSAQKADTARTYVWTAEDSHRVMAYYSVAPTSVRREDVGSRYAGGQSIIPAYLLARLALDCKLRGQDLGGQLLLNALETIILASGRGGGRLIVVDPLHERAAQFYARHDFKAIQGQRRMVMKVATARSALGVTSVNVTGDAATKLVAMVWRGPEGGAVPILTDPDGLRKVAARIEQLADDGATDLAEVMRTAIHQALGRDVAKE